MSSEVAILNHYNLTNAFPVAWPSEKDLEDDSDEEARGPDVADTQPDRTIRRSKSRYSVLDQPRDARHQVPGSERSTQGKETLVQKDEPDALGSSDSVVRALRSQGVAVDQDEKLRNRFLLSSTTFSPSLYLSQLHSNASNAELLEGLDTLARSIDSKSASLKLLVESNFERFVRAKTTIDHVYSGMRSHGADPEIPERTKGHSRVTSRESRHYRSTSNQSAFGASKQSPTKIIATTKNKNALLKESDYGVQGIKAPLVEVAVKAEELWGPSLGGRDREHGLKTALDSIDEARELFNTDKALTSCIQRKDYAHIVDHYLKFRKQITEIRTAAEAVHQNYSRLSDTQVYKIIIAGRLSTNIDQHMSAFKRNVWRKLSSTPVNQERQMPATEGIDHIQLISVLLELGVEDNPIWVWLLSRYDYLKNKIIHLFEHARFEIEVLRRRLALIESPSELELAVFLKQTYQHSSLTGAVQQDSEPVLELWDVILECQQRILSPKYGLWGEIAAFWEQAQSFIDGRAQRSLPIGIDGQSRKHHKLPPDGVKDLQSGLLELVSMLQENLHAFFAEPPSREIKSPFASTPATPVTPQSARNSLISPRFHQDVRFQFDENHPLPGLSKRGDTWEEFAFWPPFSNSLTGSHYLAQILALLGTAANEMLTLRPVMAKQSMPERLKTTVAVARERCLRALTAAWSRDAKACKALEDWHLSKDRAGVTLLPEYIASFESSVLTGVQKMLYIPEAATGSRSAGASVVTAPPSKILQMVRSQFVSSLYKILAGMVENAEKPDAADDPQKSMKTVTTEGTLGASKCSRNIRHLLTIANLQLLHNETFSSLFSQFETHFSITLTDESKQLRDALLQIISRLFLSYANFTTEQLSPIVHNGIASADWVPKTSKPTEVQPYVYEALLLLVHVHTEVSTTAPGPLTHQILTQLLEQLSGIFLSAFKMRAQYPLPALMQATLDMEFVAQTMNQYTSQRTTDIQSKIYLVLDEKTTVEASRSLQAELPEMRNVLKRLREGTKTQFVVFRRERGRTVSRSDRE